MEKFEDPKQPKAYISGPITGRSDAFERFQDAEKELKGFEFIPVNPFDNGLQDDPSIKYTDHLLKDLKMLSECQIIYMLKDWQTSRGARIEYSFAVNMGIEVMFESVVENERNARIKDVKVIDAIRNAIHEVMDQNFATMCDRHDRFGFFARMIFAHHCKNEGQMSVKQIAAMIHRDETTIRYSLTKYDGEYQFNRIFRNMAERVDDILSSFPIEKPVQMQCKCNANASKKKRKYIRRKSKKR